MTPFPKPEDVAKEIAKYCVYGHEEEIGWHAHAFKIIIGKGIKADRTRLIAYLREKMPKKNVETYDDRTLSYNPHDQDIYCEGWNSAIEAVERVLGEMK